MSIAVVDGSREFTQAFRFTCGGGRITLPKCFKQVISVYEIQYRHIWDLVQRRKKIRTVHVSFKQHTDTLTKRFRVGSFRRHRYFFSKSRR